MHHYRFCPFCAGTLRRVIEGRAIRFDCQVCGQPMYENARPCAGALVVREGKVLLGRRAIDPNRGWWDIPGGFLEFDELPYDGAIREVREETGLQVRPIELIGMWVKPYGLGDHTVWTLNHYYLAEVLAGDPRAADDLAELAWFGPDELPTEMAFEHEIEVLGCWRTGERRL